jgi:hypothetical protein
MLRQRDVREATAWIDRSGVAPEIEALLRPTLRGRPRQLTVRALLVGLKLAVDTAKTSCLTDVHHVLTEQLPEGSRIDLGIYDPVTQTTVTLPQVRRLLAAAHHKLDASPTTAPNLTADERANREAMLQDILDRLLAATMPAGVQHGGSYAVDGTGTWSWARGKRRGQPTADPDARWGVKTHKSGKNEAYYGYELHSLVRINTLGADPARTPCIAERIVIRPASSNVTTPVLDLLAGMQQQGLRLRDVVADRGYSYKLDWTPGLHALGIDPVFDLHATQYGPRGSHYGARIVTGVPHCPAMPEAFDTIRRPERLADNPELTDFTRRIDQRAQWAFRRVTGPDTAGKERYECPAHAGKIRCPLHQKSLNLPLALPKATSHPAAAAAPACCTQRTITLPGTVDTKNRQRHYWGSHDWIRAFSRRSRVEGWFGNLKNDNREALNRGAFRVTGLCKTSIMLAIYAAATNLRLLRHWAQRQHDNTDLLAHLTGELNPTDDGKVQPDDVTLSSGAPPGDRPLPRR